MNVLAIDIGGTNIKFLATGQDEPRRFPSGKTVTAERMVSGVKEMTRDWQYDVVAIGYPGLVLKGHIAREPNNLAHGWIGFDFEAAFGCPVKVINDAAMQALGSYQGGTMLFLGLGTGLGAAMVVQGVVVPMELGHLSYKKGNFETYLGKGGLARLGKKKWRRHVEEAVARFISVLELDDVVIGGGNAKLLQLFPPNCRQGSNANAFTGGFRLWEKTQQWS
ncbi:MAG: ROK family protein [Leptolyngbyaceae cyanobacterium bins.302]|nr:ROK family protein [Leptolyngbyaceae cyanobacterium bins.302]